MGSFVAAAFPGPRYGKIGEVEFFPAFAPSSSSFPALP